MVVVRRLPASSLLLAQRQAEHETFVTQSGIWYINANVSGRKFWIIFQYANKMASSHSASSSSEHESLDHGEEQVESPEQAESSEQNESSEHNESSEQAESPDQPESSEAPQRKFKRALPQSKAQIAANLERIVREVLSAINAGNFDTTTAPWNTHFHSSFYAEVGMLANSPAKKKVNLTQFCEYTSARRQAYPDYGMHLTSMSTHVNTRRGKAEIFCNLELVGMPVGIVRPSVASVGFENVNGTWLFVKWVSAEDGAHMHG